jgi:hypothetical protein
MYEFIRPCEDDICDKLCPSCKIIVETETKDKVVSEKQMFEIFNKIKLCCGNTGFIYRLFTNEK